MTTAETTTAAARFLADNRKLSVKLDGYNRYVLPDPETGEERHWTRATTWAGAVKDAFGLNRWSRRMEAHGLAMRRDLVASVAADVSEFGAGNFEHRDCAKLDEAIAQAQEHAGSTVAATLGTVMHRFTELLDTTGEMPEVVPPPLDRDLAIYRSTMQRHRFTPVAVEQIVCVPELGVAGTLDRILSRGAAYIGDLKTGRDLGYGWGEIVIQQALYAHASFLWDADHWVPMPPVDQQVALIIHLPIGQARCDLWWVDVQAGWEAACELCGPVREWRNRRDLAVKIDGDLPPLPPASGEQPDEATAPAGPAPDVDEGAAATSAPVGRSDHEPDEMAAAYTRSEWISARLAALRDNERARTLVGLRWPESARPQPPWPDDTIDALAAMLDDVEAEVGAGWSASDPTKTADSPPEPPTQSPERPEPVPGWDIPDDGEIATEDDLNGLAAAFSFLAEEQGAMLARWAKDAQRLGRSFTVRPVTRRMLACAHAAYACASRFDNDAWTRSALSDFLGEWHDGWVIGAVIGSLSTEQAEALVDRFA